MDNGERPRRRSPRFALPTPPPQRLASNDGVKTGNIDYVREPRAYALPFYIANCDPEMSAAKWPIRGRSELHFETSVSICKVRSRLAEGTPLDVVLVVSYRFAGFGNRSATDFRTPGEMFMMTCPR